MNSHEAVKKEVREPLFHIAKRDGIVWWKSWLIRLCAILIAFLLCGLLCVVMLRQNPLKMYASMFAGVFGTSRRIWNFLQETAILLCVSLAVTPAFRMKFWNIGAEGQVLIGGLTATACMFYLGGAGVPGPVIILVSVLLSILASIVWAVIPAICKAFWNTNETLFTLMMNYIAMSLVNFFIKIWVPTGTGNLPPLETGRFPVIGGQKSILTIIIVAVITIAIWIYFKYSKHGYEISVVGESANTARYVGINVKKVIIRTMVLSGAICGIAGLIICQGTNYTVNADIVSNRGFTAIIVSWMGKFNPFYMVLTSILVVFLQKGSSQVLTDFSLTGDGFSDIVTGIVFFFVIGCEFFISYRLIMRGKNGGKTDSGLSFGLWLEEKKRVLREKRGAKSSAQDAVPASEAGQKDALLSEPDGAKESLVHAAQEIDAEGSDGTEKITFANEELPPDTAADAAGARPDEAHEVNGEASPTETEGEDDHV